jgi:F420-dependent oxidoreductase-like protein
MKLRIFTEPQQGASYDDLLTLARAAEDLGFDAFFRSDHYLRMGEVDGLPGPTDAWLTLAGLARETSTIRLGTLVSAATFRWPGPLAIGVAQVDAMSGGRVELGIGAGWFDDEHAAYGIEFPSLATRFDRLCEQVEIVHGLWATAPGEAYSFRGEHYTLVDSPALPKPVQRPHPPIILGGAGKQRSAALAARFADEYNAAFVSIRETAAIYDRVLTATQETGRSLVLSAAQVLCVGDSEPTLTRRAAAIGREPAELRANGLAGSPAEVVDKISRFAETGATTMYLQVLDLSDLDHLELVAASILPQV